MSIGKEGRKLQRSLRLVIETRQSCLRWFGVVLVLSRTITISITSASFMPI